jgi:hypothetical protein
MDKMKKSKKIPIQIYLDPEQLQIIDRLAKASGKSKTATIRLCIAKYLDSLPLENDPALQIMNLGASGREDIAKRHDDYLIESQN